MQQLKMTVVLTDQRIFCSPEDDASLQGSRLTSLKVNVHPHKMYNLDWVCSTLVYFCPPVSYVVQTCLSAALSHTFGVSAHTCLLPWKPEPLPLQRGGLKFSISIPCGHMMLFMSTLPYLVEAICRAYDCSNSRCKMLFKIPFFLSSNMREHKNNNWSLQGNWSLERKIEKWC